MGVQIWVSDYYIDSDLLIIIGVVGFLAIIGLALWLATRSTREKNRILEGLKGKTSATPSKSGRGAK